MTFIWNCYYMNSESIKYPNGAPPYLNPKENSHGAELLASSHKFSQEEVEVISKRFNQLCNEGISMNYEQFRRGLGLLGREDSFLCRIFNLIDSDGDGFITRQNYLAYLSVILKGSEVEKARLGWLVLTEGRGDMELKDFTQLFQQISVVWNSLTGEIVLPKKKYVEEVFNLFDVDQDQTITFSDYLLFFDEHLQLPGWFQYFNGLEPNKEASRAELERVRVKLRSKLRGQGDYLRQNPDELQMLVRDQECKIEKRLLQLTRGMGDASEDIILQRQQLKHTVSRDSQGMDRQEEHRLYSTNSRTIRSEEGSSLSIKSFYPYSHESIIKESPINKLHLRKKELRRENRTTLNAQVTSELRSFLDQTCQLMEFCSSYRALKNQQKAFSPTKLKQIEARLKQEERRPQKQEDSKEPEKKKLTVYFGHQNWNLVLNIMVGLRKSITALTKVMEIEEHHFDQHHEFYLGNKAFLSGKGPEALKNMESFLFISVAPAIFQRLRQQAGVDNVQYQKSVGPQGLLNQILTGDLTALNQKCSTGKSGAFFYLTSDNRVFLKTLPKHEFEFFTKIVKNYYTHMTDHQNTLIVRIFGLYKLKVYQNKQKIDTFYFISMENIFAEVKEDPRCKIEEVFDLKGSLYGRTGTDGGQLKDQDWIQRDRTIKLPQALRAPFMEQITADSRFFKKNNINDYSLMVAVVRHQGNLTASGEKNVFKQVRGGVVSRQAGMMYVLSIIDILTVFEGRKNLEYFFKSTFLSKDVSCIPPSDYCARFRAFIHNSV